MWHNKSLDILFFSISRPIIDEYFTHCMPSYYGKQFYGSLEGEEALVLLLMTEKHQFIRTSGAFFGKHWRSVVPCCLARRQTLGEGWRELHPELRRESGGQRRSAEEQLAAPSHGSVVKAEKSEQWAPPPVSDVASATCDSLEAAVGWFVQVVLVEAVSSLAQLVAVRRLARWRVATETSMNTINPKG